MDHNEQVQRGSINGAPVVHGLERVCAQSRARLMDPFAGIQPKQAEDVVRHAREHQRSAGGAPVSDSGYGSDRGTRSYLEEWLEKRAQNSDVAASDRS